MNCKKSIVKAKQNSEEQIKILQVQREKKGMDVTCKELCLLQMHLQVQDMAVSAQ